jgi:hypothetical protein
MLSLDSASLTIHHRQRRLAPMMTRKQAQAILACQIAVLNALEKCEKVLDDEELTYFQNYWGAHIRSIVRGNGYGAAPIGRAEDIQEGIE